MKITRLRLEHQDALQAFEADFDAAGESRIPAWFARREWDQATRVEQVNGWERGLFLQPGWIPCTTRFLEADGALLGVVNVRHELNEALRNYGGHIGYSVRPSARRRGHGTQLLAAGLDVCRDLGVDVARITCAATNLGSIGVILANGGTEVGRLPREDGWTILYDIALDA